MESQQYSEYKAFLKKRKGARHGHQQRSLARCTITNMTRKINDNCSCWRGYRGGCGKCREVAAILYSTIMVRAKVDKRYHICMGGEMKFYKGGQYLPGGGRSPAGGCIVKTR